MKKYSILILFILLGQMTFATRVSYTLYLNPGTFLAVDSLTFPAYAFNLTGTYNRTNAVLKVMKGDTLDLILVNTDTLPHIFETRGMGVGQVTLPPLGTQSQSIPCPDFGVFPYLDVQDFPKYQAMGAAGMIVVREAGNFKEFYWNVREYQKDWNEDLSLGLPVVWNEYYPTYFTLNGQGKPDIPGDATAVVTGNVGDTIRIYVMNSGLSVHSLHFHGYHATIKFALSDPEKTNWSKDTVPFKTLSTKVLEVIPDKPGMYPVHDHNLIAVTGGGIYPNGIFMMMQIQ
ncbi:MAG: multicopper oxidase domain-containing protein [Bacteroidia bacterium]|nr:multicopper oxidase domain-containing protein [Bacteroidia bacterium]